MTALRRSAVTAAAATLAALILVWLEWFFFATKPSFLSSLPVDEIVGVALRAGALAGIVAGALSAAITALSAPLDAVHPTIGRVARGAIGCALLVAIGLLLIDNFSYTVFRFGVRTVTGLWRLLYLVLLVALAIGGWRLLRSWWDWFDADLRTRLGGLLAFVGIGVASCLFVSEREITSDIKIQTSRTPNIIILSTDGIEADVMSVYGYERDTTPKLRARIERDGFVRYDNAFCNSAGTASSIVSMLTGRLPTRTGFFYFPDQLRGEAAVNHLPGLLRSAGYLNYIMAVQQFANPHDFNMQNAFDWSDVRRVRPTWWGRAQIFLAGFDAYRMLQVISEKITDRLLNIVWIRDMENAYRMVTEGRTAAAWDASRVEIMERLIRTSREPYFIYAHLMGTHGPMYAPQTRHFSHDGGDETQEWDIDRRRDAILDFDTYVERIITLLEQQGTYDNTLLIITSDHGYMWDVMSRLPLLIRYGAGEHAGVVAESVQLLDLAPTVVDYLGSPIPDWMQGISMLQRPLPRGRRLWSARRDKDLTLVVGHVEFRQRGRWYTISLVDHKVRSGEIPGYSGPEGVAPAMEEEKARLILRRHLLDNGYDPDNIQPATAGARKTVSE